MGWHVILYQIELWTGEGERCPEILPGHMEPYKAQCDRVKGHKRMHAVIVEWHEDETGPAPATRRDGT
jgi:hypothetical protein